MEVIDIKYFPLSIPYIDDPQPLWVNEWGIQLYIKALVREEGQEIRVGWGETLVAGSGIISSYIGVIEDLLIPYIMKERKINSVSSLFERLEKITFTAGNCGVVSGAFSGVEMALNHASNSYKYIGRVRERVPVYASFPRYKDCKEALKASRIAVERGFDLIKLHQPYSEVEDCLKEIKREINVKVAIDLNCPFDYERAIKFLDRISRYEVEWVEEPIWPPNDYETMSKLAEKTGVLIAAGENEFTLTGFKRLMNSGIALVQPDIAKIGGLKKFMDVLSLAKAMNIKVIPHLRPQRSYIALFHTLYVASTNLWIKMVEYPLAPLPRDVFPLIPEVKKGEAIVPDNLVINEDALRNYPFERKLRVLMFSDLPEGG